MFRVPALCALLLAVWAADAHAQIGSQIASQPAHATAPRTFTGLARSIDGDTVMVGTRKVRLIGIDAPEYEQTCKLGRNEWRCGADAASALGRLVEGRSLDCVHHGYDVYGRTLATCSLPDAGDLGEAMLTKGFAVLLRGAPEGYAPREAQSKAARTGIWASQFQLPVDYRAAHPRGSETWTPGRDRDRNADRPSLVGSTRPAPLARTNAGTTPLYRNCAEARAAGAAPLHRGQPGYDPRMDGDGDGIACEPYRSRR